MTNNKTMQIGQGPPGMPMPTMQDLQEMEQRAAAQMGSQAPAQAEGQVPGSDLWMIEQDKLLQSMVAAAMNKQRI